MDKKQLAEMIKVLRKNKIEETVGKPEKFDPKHKSTHPEDPTSPNQAIEEALGSTYGKRKKHKFFQRKLPDQRTWTKSGQQSMRGGKRYTAESEEKLGATDTGKKSAAETDTVSVNPKDNTALAKGDMNKNTTVKETKEK